MSDERGHLWWNVPPAEKAAYCFHVAPFVDALNTELREVGILRQASESDDLRPFLHDLVDAARQQGARRGQCDSDPCEGCGRPSTQRDTEDVPLCDDCYDAAPHADTCRCPDCRGG